MQACTVPTPIPRRCQECGTEISRNARRCSSCHGRYALSFAWRSPNRSSNRPVGGPIGPVVHAFVKTGVVVRAFVDRRGALIVAPSGIYIVEVHDRELRYTDKDANWSYRVDLALGHGGAEFVVVRSEADVRGLVRRVGEGGPSGQAIKGRSRR